MLHVYVNVDDETGKSVSLMTANVNLRLMQKDGLFFLLHCRPIHMSIIVSGNVVEMPYNTCCIELTHLLACMFVNFKANQKEVDLLLLLYCRLLPYKTQHW